MSEVLALVLTGLVIAVALGTYAFALHRYEAGRKVPIFFLQTKVRWPYRRNRFPSWFLSLQWICGLGVTFSFVDMIAAPGPSETRAESQLRAVGIMLAMFLMAFLAQALITEMHNRRSASYPPSGWYEAPENPENMRWWNGVEWLDYTFPKDRVAPDPYAPTTTE